jgi:hypothetical protein
MESGWRRLPGQATASEGPERQGGVVSTSARRHEEKTGRVATVRAEGKLDEAEVRRELARYGLTLTVSVMKGGVAHWQVRDHGGIVLHCWPRKGSWWRPSDGEKGNVASVDELVLLAGRTPFPPEAPEAAWWGPLACSHCAVELATVRVSAVVPYLCRECVLRLER